MDISIVMSTYNRSIVLSRAIDGLMAQELGGLTYEIIVVDNNSTDNTRQVIASYTQRDPRIRYIFEEKQGVAYGRNAGIAAAKGEYLAFCDDDVIVASDWMRRLHAALLRFPQADFVGGKVLPVWKTDPPSWITGRLEPLALQDYGSQSELVSVENRHCLISACLAVRRTAFERAGYFDPATQRVGNSIGSTEDYDWEMKILDNGGVGVYVPDVVCYAEVSADRMRKSYHRRWQLGHGKFNAIARRPNLEGGSFQVLGVPSFVYRQLAQATFRYLTALPRGNAAETFERENKVFFFWGFIRHRWKQTFAGPSKTESSARHQPSADAS